LPAALLLVFPLLEFQLSAQGRPALLYSHRRWALSRGLGRRAKLHRSSVGHGARAGRS
jgi:hypothetical protein